MTDDDTTPLGSAVLVWDSHTCPPTKAFGGFRDYICSTLLPWSLEKFRNEDPFEARLELTAWDSVAIAQTSCTPHMAVRTRSNIARSSDECFYVVYIQSGRAIIEHAGHDTKYAGAGDLTISDSQLLHTVKFDESARVNYLAVRVPKRAFAGLKDAHDHFGSLHLPAERLLRPLASCLNHIALHVHTSPKEELFALYEAVTSLLPVAAGAFGSNPPVESPADYGSSGIFQEVLSFIRANISRAELSPQQVAGHCGISLRYVHKLFACRGTTFSTYVADLRLEYLRRDVISGEHRNRTLAELAYRWGFKDYSTFYRAFRRRFGHKPMWLRDQGEP